MSNQREIKCPNCSGQVLAKTGGRAFASITGFLQRSFNIKFPTGLVSYLKEKMPVSKQSIFKEGCPMCKGKGNIIDPSDDSAKYKKVEQLAKQYEDEILDLENRLGPPCGNRYTIIQGSDLLEVGLGMNNAPSYRVDKDKNIRNKGLIDPGKINTSKAGPQIPEGGTCNHVQGINSLASPGGHYMIKCSNKFSVVAGAQGIELITGGPVTISGGITRFTAPELSIGSSTGRLSLHGDVVDIGGRSVEVAPTDGHFFVKGTISNTGNVMVGGHMHSESVSFVKAECTGRNEITKPAASSDLYGGPAFWGGVGVEGIIASLKDLLGFVTSKTTNPTEAQQIMTPRFVESFRDKVLNMTYNAQPWEIKPTGYILPGTSIVLTGTCPCNYPTPGSQAVGIVTGTVVAPIPINNFPHVHALPDNEHVHEVRIPDIDCSADSAAEVRSKQGGISAPAPLGKSSTSALQAGLSLFSSIGMVFMPVWKAINGQTGPYQKS
jgi:hypothetical protein